MKTDLSKAPAVAGPVELPVRPVAWLCEYRSGEEFVSLASDPMRDPDVMSAVPLVPLSSCNAAVAAERERCARLCEDRAIHQNGRHVVTLEMNQMAQAIRGKHDFRA